MHDLVQVYPEILQWASVYGFTEDELAWIQPTYGGGCDMNGSEMIISSSCSNACGGMVVLPVPSLNPPFTMVGPDCTNLCPGNYNWVFFDSNGNSSTFNATVGFNDSVAFILDTTTTSAPQNCDGSIIVTPVSEIPPFVYTLYDQNATQISSGTDSVFSNLCFGTYYVNVTDSYGCSTSPQQTYVNAPTTNGIIEINTSSLLLYPNPARDFISVSVPSNNTYSVDVISVDGRKVISEAISGKITTDISSLKRRFYFVAVSGNENYYSGFVKEQ
ncbi:MAG: T9SS type A sorting domain-containing protein [Bacteroidota bacterium]